MNSFKMHHLLLIPMMVLAVNACAKRDSNFGKKNPGTQGAATDPATQEGAKTEDADGSLPYAPNCINPIAMEAAEGQEAVEIADLLKEAKGTYSLINTQYFVEAETKEGEAKEQLHTQGSEYKTPEDFSAAITDTQKTAVICYTIKPIEGKELKIRASMDLPNSFNAADGKGSVLRQDTVVVKNGSIKSLSTIYSGSYDVKNTFGEGKSEGVKVLVIKHDKNRVTLKMQFNRSDLKTGKKSLVTASGTYVLSKEVEEVKGADLKVENEEKEKPK